MISRDTDMPGPAPTYGLSSNEQFAVFSEGRDFSVGGHRDENDSDAAIETWARTSQLCLVGVRPALIVHWLHFASCATGTKPPVAAALFLSAALLPCQ